LEGNNCCSAKETFEKFCNGCGTESLFTELTEGEVNGAAMVEGAVGAEDEGTVEGDMGGEKDGGRGIL
jgi:hypothetical protein